MIVSTSDTFKIFGMTTTEIFPIQNLSLISWVFMIVAPRLGITPIIALLPPILFAGLYGVTLFHVIQHPAPGTSIDFTSLESIAKGFQQLDGAFAGWMHYCVVDILLGLGIILDAERVGIPHLLCIPCLILTLFAAPLGFLSYLFIRIIYKGLNLAK
eukprot:CAMPEP_0167747870 /NCGR_PEP_ID=MMETSP0110_2-20121227/4523_1 /TAXON_ID=629695 /ORGANISM="Gymnochlora sp., Strain CCMP2014" /LENGTH=156 /DNA_ID=CAMNT_0007632823 /DNA_START=404 /DNA_END=874 /DNA_ORIENTATION=+